MVLGVGESAAVRKRPLVDHMMWAKCGQSPGGFVGKMWARCPKEEVLMELVKILGAFVLMAALACGPPIEAADMSPDQVAMVKDRVSRNIQPEHLPVVESEWAAVCDNYEEQGWNYDRMMERLTEVHGSGYNRPVAIYGELLVWLWEVMDPPDRVAAAPSLLKGFCGNP